jgi:hypothetical protein
MVLSHLSRTFLPSRKYRHIGIHIEPSPRNAGGIVKFWSLSAQSFAIAQSSAMSVLLCGVLALVSELLTFLNLPYYRLGM